MTSITLPDRDHRHELRNMLPYADDVSDAELPKIAPDRGSAQWQPEMKARRLHRRRAEQDRIGAKVDCLHLHNRTGPFVGGVITGEFAERAFWQHFLRARQQLALEHGLGSRWQQQIGQRARSE